MLLSTLVNYILVTLADELCKARMFQYFSWRCTLMYIIRNWFDHEWLTLALLTWFLPHFPLFLTFPGMMLNLVEAIHPDSQQCPFWALHGPAFSSCDKGGGFWELIRLNDTFDIGWYFRVPTSFSLLSAHFAFDNNNYLKMCQGKAISSFCFSVKYKSRCDHYNSKKAVPVADCSFVRKATHHYTGSWVKRQTTQSSRKHTEKHQYLVQKIFWGRRKGGVCKTASRRAGPFKPRTTSIFN